MAEQAVTDLMAINTEAIAKATALALRQELNSMKQEANAQAQQNREARARQQAVEQVGQDPLAQTLQPYIAPVARALNLKADNAMDAVRFYNRNKEALKHEAEIENIVNTMAAQGQAFDRDTAYKFLKGAKFDQFVDQEIKAREERTNESARAGMAIGASGVSGPMIGRLAGLGPNTSLADLDAALAGHSF